MSGVRRLIVADITVGNLRGKALSDALAKGLTEDQRSVSDLKKKIDNTPKKSTYGKKK